MASTSGQAGNSNTSGGFGSRNEDRDQNLSNKRHPLIHDHLQQQQKSTDPNNVFSIDRTFSASSTDIQPSFEIFDEEEDEDDSSGRARRKAPGRTTKTGSGHTTKDSGRAKMYKEMIVHHNRHQQRRNDNTKSKFGQGNFSTAKKENFGKEGKGKSIFIEGEDSSIGVPSDISGMLRDSDVMDNEDGFGGEGEKGRESEKRNNNSNFDKDGDKIMGDRVNNNDNGDNAPGGQSTSMRIHNQRKILKSSMISDGRFGSVNSVSSSFNSAAAAMISSSSGGGNSEERRGGGSYSHSHKMNHNSNNTSQEMMMQDRLDRYHRYRGAFAPLDRCNSTSVSSAHSSSLSQHYYPEGGWGYVVLATAIVCHALMSGLHLSAGIFLLNILHRFGEDLVMSSVWLISLSMGSSLFLSPLWVSICKRRSTRLTAVLGGLVTSLACLFTSFASQFHQTFISFGIILSIGVGLSRDASYLMVGQYFKRKREYVEIFLVAGSGLGILVMALALHTALSGLGWRFGLQALTGGLFSTFFLGTCYRSASLYHPQRRAILHLKNQKRKIKEKGKRSDRPPFLDYSCLSSRSLQLLILSTAFTAFGSYSPLFHLALECARAEMPMAHVIYLYLYIGTGWILGSCFFGMTVVQRNEDCRISKPYLLQGATLIIGGALFALATFDEEHSLGSFCWIYGFGLGSYNYVLKAWTYEKTRAKNFSRAWSFVQCAQGLGCIFGVPASGYMNYYAGWRTGYFMSSASVFFSALIIFCCGMRRRQLMRNKSGTSSMKTCETFDSSGMQSPTGRRISFTFPDDQISPRLMSKGSNRSAGSGSFRNHSTTSSTGGNVGGVGAGAILSDRHSGGSGSLNNSFSSCSAGNNNFGITHHQQDQPQARKPKELTCISEEGILEPHGPV